MLRLHDDDQIMLLKQLGSKSRPRTWATSSHTGPVPRPNPADELVTRLQDCLRNISALSQPAGMNDYPYMLVNLSSVSVGRS